ncbi:hypothetical protein [Streptomyces sp. NPDC002640]
MPLTPAPIPGAIHSLPDPLPHKVTDVIVLPPHRTKDHGATPALATAAPAARSGSEQ